MNKFWQMYYRNRGLLFSFLYPAHTLISASYPLRLRASLLSERLSFKRYSRSSPYLRCERVTCQGFTLIGPFNWIKLERRNGIIGIGCHVGRPLNLSRCHPNKRHMDHHVPLNLLQ